MTEGTDVEMAYPLPTKDKPLKVNGTEIEYIVIVPKGVKTEYPKTKLEGEAEKDEEQSNGEETCAELREKIQQLSEEKAKLEKERDELNTKLSAIKEEEKKERVANLVESRAKLGITPEDEKNSEIEKFMELSDEELNLVEEEFRKVEMKLSNIEAQTKAKNDGLSEIERRGLAGD